MILQLALPSAALTPRIRGTPFLVCCIRSGLYTKSPPLPPTLHISLDGVEYGACIP
jgi:hypothetical protein